MNCGLVDRLTVDRGDLRLTAIIDLVCRYCLDTTTSHSVIILASERIGLTHLYSCIHSWATHGQAQALLNSAFPLLARKGCRVLELRLL